MAAKADAKQVDETCSANDDIVLLARLAVSGDAPGVQAALRKLVRKHRSSNPEITARLVQLLRSEPTRGAAAATRVDAVPVDADTRFPLVRVEAPSGSAARPILARPLLQSLDQIIAEHQSGDALLREGLYPTRTALLTGAPGVGKTMSARWIADRLGLPLLILDLSAVMSSFLGRTGSNLRQVLDYARKTPSVLLLDELDAVAKRRDDATEIGELKRLVTVLLQEVDSWPEGSLLLAATNHGDLLDPAVWRRFEVVLDFPLPEPQAIIEALQSHFEQRSVPAELLAAVASVFEGRTLADLERHVMHSKRASVVRGVPIETTLIEIARSSLRQLPAAERGRVAARMASISGLSQRQVSEITGVSRDTIRKYSFNRAN